MTLRFSLLGLIGLTTLAALACAALVQPGVGWTSVVVSLTVLTAAWQLLRLLLQPGQPRAAALGWLVFACGYLAIVLGPWLSTNLGPQLASSKGLNYAQLNWRKEDPGDAAAGYLWSIPDGTSNTLWVDYGGGLSLFRPQTGNIYAADPAASFFQLSGHWLCAWILGWLGAALAVHFQRHARGAHSEISQPSRPR